MEAPRISLVSWSMGADEACCDPDDIDERFNAKAFDVEVGGWLEVVGLDLSRGCCLEVDGRNGPDDREEDDNKPCSRAALRFCFPLSTPFFATVVWSLQARSN